MLYDDNKIEEVDYIIYLKWFDEFIEEVKQDGIIYLQVSPETCYNRVQKRNRDGETISLKYLKSCHQYHENWLITEKNVLRLNGEDNFENNIFLLNELYNKINLFTQSQNREESFKWKEIAHC